MQLQEYLSLIAIIVTIVVAIITWFVSAHFTKKSIKTKRLAYEIKYYPIISKSFLSNTNELKIEYKGELLPEPTFLLVDIINTGNVAIENPPIQIEAVGATYIIPGFLEDVPTGYENIWTLERIDAEICAIKLKHINPKQIVKARFFLDELPTQPPVFICPMKDLELRKIDREKRKKLLWQALEAALKVRPFI